MTQQEFYNTPEVKLSIEIQKMNPYGSAEHRAAYIQIMEAAKKYGVLDKYIKAGGGDY